MSTEVPRPKRHLIEFSKAYPHAWRMVDELRAERGKGLPQWPEWCFLPLAGAYAIVSRGQRIQSLDGWVSIDDIAILGALAAWRVTQGIYRFDPDLYQALLETPVEGDIPVEVVLRLPEWCVYIETPGYLFGSDPVHGFFTHLENDMNDGRIELRLVLDVGDQLTDLIPFPLHLVGTVRDALVASAKEMQRVAKTTGRQYLADPIGFADTVAPLLSPLVSLVLYLCSATAEYAGDRRPSRPRPARTKRGPRLFPPDQPTVWYTGFRIGAALRQARSEYAATSDAVAERRSPRPHIRRAHWHAFWTGPRSEPAKRKLVLHWLPPIPVNIAGIEGVNPTIREVKGPWS